MGSAVSASKRSGGDASLSSTETNSDDLQVEVKVYHCNSSRGRPSNFTISQEGVVMQGSNSKTALDIGQSYANATGRSLQRYELNDARACQLLVVSHLNSFWAIPAPEAFSRHSGTCRMLGDRKHTATPHVLSVGDVIRVGSVGLVVTEVHNGEKPEALKDETIERLVRDTVSVVSADIQSAEGGGENGSEATNGESEAEGEKMCYCCFSDDDLLHNPLVSPCGCKGDTKWIHIECLRKWHKTGNESDICSVTSVMASCSVCKSSYKSSVPLPDGSSANIFNSTLPPPYVSFLVVTKHEMAKTLYNTRFQLSFATVMKPDGENSIRDLSIGRSSTSDMVLDYRTVSAHHAQVRFRDGQFQFVDAQSSNGSFLYLRKPVQLNVNTTTNLRLGRSLLSLKVTRNKWRSQIISNMSRKLSRSFSSDAGHAKEAAIENNSSSADPLPEEDNHIRPNTEEHFMLIQDLARPSGLAAQSPSHASNLKQYNATTGFFESESGDALDDGAPGEASASAGGNGDDDVINGSSSGAEGGIISNSLCQGDGEEAGGEGESAVDGGRQEESAPLVVPPLQQQQQPSGVDGGIDGGIDGDGGGGGDGNSDGDGDGGGAAASPAAVAATPTASAATPAASATLNNSLIQNDIILPTPGFERRDTLLLPDQELLMSFEQNNDEVKDLSNLNSTCIIHPEYGARGQTDSQGRGDDDVASNSSFGASPSNNSSDMIESQSPLNSPQEFERRSSRQHTMTLSAPKGQPSWDEIGDVDADADEKLSANEVKNDEDFKGGEEHKSFV